MCFDIKRIQGDKARVCKLGETAVIQKLTELGWDAFNANTSNPNYKGVDIMCINPFSLETKFIQVKASAEDEPNFPTGLVYDPEAKIIGRKGEEQDAWKKKIVGSWVFVHIKQGCDGITYKFYILTKKELTCLIEHSNNWYWNNVGKTEKPDQPIGLPISWVTGEKNGKVKNLRGWRLYPGCTGIENPQDAWWKIGVPKKDEVSISH